MKKKLTILALLVCCLLLSVVFASCNKDNNNSVNNNNVTTCTHEHATFTDTATCEEDGVRTYTCPDCAKTWTEEIGAPGHNFVKDQDHSTAPTCTAAGKTVEQCTRCKQVKTTTEPQLTHNYVKDDDSSKDATCTNTGVIVEICSLCKDSRATFLPALGHKWEGFDCTGKQCSVCKETQPAVRSHDYAVKSSSEATCTEDCKTVYECSICHDQYAEVALKTGHTYVVKEGSESGKFDPVAGKMCTFETSHVLQCTKCNDEQIEKYEIVRHEYVTEITKAAKCNESGETALKCHVCGDIKADSKKEFTDLNAHNWDNGQVNENVTTFTCQDCHTTKKSIVAAADAKQVPVSKDALTGADDVQVGGASIALDDTAKQSLPENGELTLGVDVANKASDIDQSLQDKLANDVYNITLSQSGGGNITSFGEGKVTVRIPYTLSDGEDVDAIVIWYVEGNQLTNIEGKYSNGYVTFETTHFSYYTVGKYTPEEMCEKYGHHNVTRTKEASCTENGYSITVCTRCGAGEEPTYTQASGHSFAKVDAESHDATCTENGLIVSKCSKCEAEIREIVRATGHEWQSSQKEEATCEKSGSETFSCAHCATTYTLKIAQRAHDFETSKKEATCTEDGYTTYSCKNCDYEYQANKVSAFGHRWDLDVPTCGQGQTCLVCGEKGADATGDHQYKDGVCTVCGTGCTHSWEKVSEVGSTCVNKGYTLYQCSNCKVQKKDDFKDLTDHAYTSEGVCSVCGTGCDHVWQQQNEVESTCDVAGYTVYECSKCHVQKHDDFKKLAEHKFTTEGTCSVCGEVCAHVWVEKEDVASTCKTAGYTLYQCSTCQKEKKDNIKPLGNHKYKDGACSVCGARDDSSATYYETLLKSLKAKKFTISVDKEIVFKMAYISHEYGPDGPKEVFINQTIKINKCKAYVNIAEDGTITFSGDLVVDMTEEKEGEDPYTYKENISVVSDGKYLYVKMSENGEDPTYLRESFDDAMSEPMNSIFAILRDPKVRDYIGTLLTSNNSNMANLLGKVVDMVCTRTETTNGYDIALSSAKMRDLNNDLRNLSVKKLVDKYLGEGKFDELVDLVRELTTKKTVAEAIDRVFELAQDYHIDRESLFSIIEYVMTTYFDQQINIEDILKNDPFNKTIAQIVEENAELEEGQFEETLNSIVGTLSDDASTVYALIDQLTAGGSDSGPDSDYPGNGPDAEEESSISEIVYDVINAIFKDGVAEVVLHTDKTGAVLSLGIAANNMTLPESVDNVQLDGAVSITWNEGEDVVYNEEIDIPSDLFDFVREQCAKNDGKYSYSVTESDDERHTNETTYLWELKDDVLSLTMTSAEYHIDDSHEVPGTGRREEGYINSKNNYDYPAPETPYYAVGVWNHNPEFSYDFKFELVYIKNTESGGFEEHVLPYTSSYQKVPFCDCDVIIGGIICIRIARADRSLQMHSIYPNWYDNPTKRSVKMRNKHFAVVLTVTSTGQKNRQNLENYGTSTTFHFNSDLIAK